MLSHRRPSTWLALKLVLWEDNPKHGLPRHNALILLFNQANGKWPQPSKQAKLMRFGQQRLMLLRPTYLQEKIQSLGDIWYRKSGQI